MKNNPKVYYFRTDGYPKKNLSFGHFFRCLAIAKYLKRKKKEIVFLIKHEKYVKKFFLKFNIKYININDNRLFKIGSDILIIDLPFIHLRDIAIARKDSKIIIIDDFLKNKFDCHHYITSNFKQKKFSFRYKKFFLSPACRLFNNMDYYKNYKKRKINKKKILIFFGGSDLLNFQIKLYKKICEENLNKKFKFYFYLGPGIKKSNKYFYEKNKNIFFFNKYEEIKKLTKSVFLTICNGGNAMFEMLHLNIPCLTIPSNSTEKTNINFFEKKKIAIKYKNDKSLNEQITFFLNNKRKKIFDKNCKKYFGKIMPEKILEKAFLKIENYER